MSCHNWASLHASVSSHTMFGGGEAVRAVDGLPVVAFVRRQVSSTKPRMCGVHSTYLSRDT